MPTQLPMYIFFNIFGKRCHHGAGLMGLGIHVQVSVGPWHFGRGPGQHVDKWGLGTLALACFGHVLKGRVPGNMLYNLITRLRDLHSQGHGDC